MKSGIRRSIKTGQLQLREMNLQVNGSLATPTVTGFDEFQIDSIVDLGVGTYQILLGKGSFERGCQLKGFGCISAAGSVVAIASDFDRITVEFRDAAGALADEDFFINILGSDFRNNH